MNQIKEIDTEEMRCRKVIIKYNSEIQNLIKITNQIIEKGYAVEKDNVKITDKGIEFIEAFIQNSFELDEHELDILACNRIYKHCYKIEPSKNSQLILRKMLLQNKDK